MKPGKNGEKGEEPSLPALRPAIRQMSDDQREAEELLEQPLDGEDGRPTVDDWLRELREGIVGRFPRSLAWLILDEVELAAKRPLLASDTAVGEEARMELREDLQAIFAHALGRMAASSREDGRYRGGRGGGETPLRHDGKGNHGMITPEEAR